MIESTDVREILRFLKNLEILNELLLQENFYPHFKIKPRDNFIHIKEYNFTHSFKFSYTLTYLYESILFKKTSVIFTSDVDP